MYKLKFAALLFFAFAGTSLIHSTQAEELKAAQDFTIEAKESINKQAPILVLFMSKTCRFCEIVLHDFLLPMQRDPEYDNKVIMRQIEYNSKNKLIDFNGNITSQSAFASKNKVWAVPTIILFDGQGRELAKIVGLLTVDYYATYLDDAINESQAKIKSSSR
jgi:thioredoxin-related protein